MDAQDEAEHSICGICHEPPGEGETQTRCCEEHRTHWTCPRCTAMRPDYGYQACFLQGPQKLPENTEREVMWDERPGAHDAFVRAFLVVFFTSAMTFCLPWYAEVVNLAGTVMFLGYRVQHYRPREDTAGLFRFLSIIVALLCVVVRLSLMVGFEEWRHLTGLGPCV